MAFHDSAFISLACHEWETPDDSHLSENKVTTACLKELSGDLFFSLSRGKTTNGIPATEAFPVLKDPMCINRGIECHWNMFQQCCPLADHAVPKLLCEFNCLLQRSQESPRAFRSRIDVCRGWLLQADFPLSERQCVMQLAIGLQHGAHRDACKTLWMECKRGNLQCKQQSLESLVQDATVNLDADGKCCPEPGVCAVVPPAPSLRPTGTTTASGKARLATDTQSGTTPPVDTSTDPRDPQAVVDASLTVSRCSDAAAKRILHTFRCPHHLIPWKGGSRTEDHFLNTCPIVSHKHKCEHLPQGPRKRPDADAPRAQRAAGETDDDGATPDAVATTDGDGSGKWNTPSPRRHSSAIVPDPSTPSPHCSDSFSALQDPVESIGVNEKAQINQTMAAPLIPQFHFLVVLVPPGNVARVARRPASKSRLVRPLSLATLPFYLTLAPSVVPHSLHGQPSLAAHDRL